MNVGQGNKSHFPLKTQLAWCHRAPAWLHEVAGSIPNLNTSGNDHFAVCLASSRWRDLTVLPYAYQKLTHSWPKGAIYLARHVPDDDINLELAGHQTYKQDLRHRRNVLKRETGSSPTVTILSVPSAKCSMTTETLLLPRVPPQAGWQLPSSLDQD